MKKKETNNKEAPIAVLLVAATPCVIQLAPVIDAHPVGGAILALIACVGAICWMLKKEK